MGVSHKLSQTNIVMAHTWFTICFLTAIFTKYSSQQLQNSGQPNQQYQPQFYSQEQYQQIGNENPRNTIYEYQENRQEISQVYDNSLHKQQDEHQVSEGSNPVAQSLPYPSSNAIYTPTKNDQFTPQARVPDQIQSRVDVAPLQSRFSTIVSKISEFIRAFFNSEGTARNDHPGLAAILSVSSLIVASILYI